MEVIAGERRSGRTSALIDWLLEGTPTDVYPFWSRVIVCRDLRRVLRVTEMVKLRTMVPAPLDSGLEETLTDIRKAVWSMHDLQSNIRGSRKFEFAVDDIDDMLSDFFYGRRPDAISVDLEGVIVHVLGSPKAEDTSA